MDVPSHLTDPALLLALRQKLLTWFDKHGRTFPWRQTRNPYHVLMAEMMLRRTQARQVVPVFHQFLLLFPDPSTLTTADSSLVERTLYSLGLAWRVPAFQGVAQALVDRFHGQVIADYHELLTLPGVGDYVAAAVCCFAFEQPLILADTNTVRVAGRVFGVPTNAESRRRKSVRALLEYLLDTDHPREFNLGLLDLAALICVPGIPHCDRCPILEYCITGREQIHDRLA